MLVAIMLVALGTIIAASVAYESAMSARRGSAVLDFDEALLVGQGAEALAAYGLKAVVDNNQTSNSQQTAGSTSTPTSNAGGTIYPGQPWAQPVGPIEVVPGVTLEASLEDLQGRFNLNWLVTQTATAATNGLTTGTNGAVTTPPVTTNNTTTTGAVQPPGPDPAAVAAFNKLLETVGIEPKWADLLIDWIDSDNQPQSQGGEDSLYLGQTVPYLAANRYITSTTELLALPGFGRENYLKLAPYISALPPNSMLNICTASGAVLDAFTVEVSWSRDEPGLAKQRESANACFPDLNQYNTLVLANPVKMTGNRIGQTSQFFRLTSLITIGTTEFNLYSLLYMDTQHYLHPIQRSFSPD